MTLSLSSASSFPSSPSPPRHLPKRHNSAWLYFPHVELVFLLFAYQGASTAEARMIRSGCLPLVVFGACALVRTEKNNVRTRVRSVQ